MGAFSSSVNPEVREFIDAVNTVFRHTEYLTLRPPFLYGILARKQWREFDAAWTVIYKTGENRKMSYIPACYVQLVAVTFIMYSKISIGTHIHVFIYNVQLAFPNLYTLHALVIHLRSY